MGCHAQAKLERVFPADAARHNTHGHVPYAHHKTPDAVGIQPPLCHSRESGNPLCNGANGLLPSQG